MARVTLDFETQELADYFTRTVSESGEVIESAEDNAVVFVAVEVIPEPEEDLELLAAVYKVACMAADMEASKPGPPSRIRNPDGTQQQETGAEIVQRIVGAALDCAVKNGLLIVPGDLEARMDAGVSIR